MDKLANLLGVSVLLKVVNESIMTLASPLLPASKVVYMTRKCGAAVMGTTNLHTFSPWSGAFAQHNL
jgi:hypothetical protein